MERKCGLVGRIKWWARWTLWWHIRTLPCRIGVHNWKLEIQDHFDVHSGTFEYDEWVECSRCYMMEGETASFGRLVH